MSTFNPDAGIPLLTEIIKAPQAADAAQAPSRPVETRAPAGEAAAAAQTDAERWTQLESELQERVLQQVLGRIDAILEQRVRDGLADVLQIAVDDLARQIRQSLHLTLSEAVKGAVRQEIDAARPTRSDNH